MKHKLKQPTLPSTPRSLAAVVTLVLEDVPAASRLDVRVICQHVKDRATASEWLTWGELNLAQGVRNALRAKDADGMPRAVHVGDGYKDAKQLEFPDYVLWAYSMAHRGREMDGRAREIAVLCAERTGRTFDAEDVIHAAHAGEAVDAVIARLAA